MKTILSLLLATASIALARLEETRAQCQARYGSPIETTENSLTFEKDSLRIQITFPGVDPQAKASAITFAKLPSHIPGRYSPMPAAGILTHLTDAQPGDWQRQLGGAVMERWVSPNGKLTATFDHKLKILSISQSPAPSK
jgi:hypothetical protein